MILPLSKNSTPLFLIFPRFNKAVLAPEAFEIVVSTISFVVARLYQAKSRFKRLRKKPKSAPTSKVVDVNGLKVEFGTLELVGPCNC
ncbi:hypothetical protein D3C84_942990 [compost metagenome]